MRIIEDISLESNVHLLMRERGKLVPGSLREGHNVFTVNGKNWLSRLISWYSVGSVDVAYTNRRVRWVGLGSGALLESSTVVSLMTPVLVSPSSYLASVQAVEFPDSSSVRFIREFGLNEVTIAGIPVMISEAGLYADVSPANNGAEEDTSYDPEVPTGTVLDPTIGTNSVIAYKSFDGLAKTIDFTIEIRWDFRFA